MDPVVTKDEMFRYISQHRCVELISGFEMKFSNTLTAWDKHQPHPFKLHRIQIWQALSLGKYHRIVFRREYCVEFFY
jgi:hypothetical protein